jgi:membrane-bound ClpP family serine protease
MEVSIMGASIGVIIGIVGLAALIAGLIWLAINSYKKQPIKNPAVTVAISLIICIIGYFQTPTGLANMRLIINNLFN